MLHGCWMLDVGSCFFTTGELINLMQVDATKIEMFIPQCHVMWDGLFQILGYMTILYTLIGWPCFAGLAIMICAGPIQGIVMGKLFALNRKMVKFTDKRVEATNEALQGIQCVKMYTWEPSFAKDINKARWEELTFLRGLAYLRGFTRAYMGALPGIVAVTSFVVYALGKKNAVISPSTLFSALVAFDQLRFPLMFYPMAFAQLAQAKVSAARIQVFLGLKEIGRGETAKFRKGNFQRNEDGTGEIVIKNASVYWNDPDTPLADTTEHGDSLSLSSIHENDDAEAPAVRYPKAILKNINLRIAPGQLCAVVGRVASGKSTLCSAILNETVLEEGDIILNGKVAYAAQSAWILNASLRDNILFGLPMDEEKYNRVIKACQLEHDLAMLTDGDLTEIGERGINLSGGQKQRVSVARAAYSNADVIILDDPLSALDPEVGKALFEECIVELMKGKTRLFVTNQIQFLSSCDTVVALKRGEIIEQGKYAELMADGKSEVNRLLAQLSSGQDSKKKEGKKNADDSKSEERSDEQKTVTAPKKAAALLTKEEQMVGAVALAVYRKYVTAGGGYVKFAVVYLGYILSALNSLANTSWISYWTSDPQYKHHSQGFYLGLYFLFAVSLGLFTFFRSFFLVRFGVKASENLHTNLLDSVLRAPQSFFDTTPLGRILSRFSKDFYSIDNELTDMFDFFLFCTLQVVLSLITVMFVTPWFGVAVVPLTFIYIRILNYFREVNRSTKRLDSVSRSPVYAHFSEVSHVVIQPADKMRDVTQSSNFFLSNQTLGGLTTIRAYGETSRFIHEFDYKLDNNTRAYYNWKASDRWLSVRLEIIGSVIAGLAATFATQTALSQHFSGSANQGDFASLAGLSLTFSISLTGLLNWCVRSFAQMEAAMNACERVIYYAENIPQEAPYTGKELQEAALKTKDPAQSDASIYAVVASGGKVVEIPSDWPHKGEIVLHNLQMKYRSDTPLVLKGLNVTISAGQRIGVVGRTGSGKSSLLLTLLRLVEPTLPEDVEYKAPISIDGVDVLRIGLQDLRSRLGIIPQNPVLFSGTIRSNIDPFNQYSDEQIWAALERCGLKKAVEEMPGQLDGMVAEYGQNLSSGMRQMLVLGRALLRQCRILLLDEATSSVDFETDREIQRTLREAFTDCTILTIAHRINTIMDSDKILVMKDGLAAEFGPPQELLKDENSFFSEIVHHAESSNQSD